MERQKHLVKSRNLPLTLGRVVASRGTPVSGPSVESGGTALKICGLCVIESSGVWSPGCRTSCKPSEADNWTRTLLATQTEEQKYD
ncbi:hypothetical protein BJX62DRAFT_214846, partial [Aspergillus germanicus]